MSGEPLVVFFSQIGKQHLTASKDCSNKHNMVITLLLLLTTPFMTCTSSVAFSSTLQYCLLLQYLAEVT